MPPSTGSAEVGQDAARDVRPLVTFYGDDFTGSTDALAQFHRVGLDGSLLITPSDDVLARLAGRGTEVVGLAGISRSLSGARLRDEVTRALRWLQRLDAPFVQYKLCSTFDSSRGVGNLGEVVRLGQVIFARRPVPVMPAQPEFGRFTVFGHHFAREADTVYRLDRHPTMSTHPSTPMRESDLRVELGSQADITVAGLAVDDLRRPPDVTAQRFAELASSGDDAVVLDALTNDDIVAAGRLLWQRAQEDPLFAMGSGGMSFGVGQHLGAEGLAPGRREDPSVEPVERVLVLSGSLAPQTQRQIELAVGQGWVRVPVDLRSLVDPTTVDEECERALARIVAGYRRARGVVLDTLATGRVEPARAHEDGDTSRTLGRGLARLLRGALREVELPRVIVCGGDTSGHTVTGAGVDALTVRARLDVAVTMCRAWSLDDPVVDGLEMVLKGGQAGDVGLFGLALDGGG